jgi:hypothetical protein
VAGQVDPVPAPADRLASIRRAAGGFRAENESGVGAFGRSVRGQCSGIHRIPGRRRRAVNVSNGAYVERLTACARCDNAQQNGPEQPSRHCRLLPTSVRPRVSGHRIRRDTASLSCDRRNPRGGVQVGDQDTVSHGVLALVCGGTVSVATRDAVAFGSLEVRLVLLREFGAVGLPGMRLLAGVGVQPGG